MPTRSVVRGSCLVWCLLAAPAAFGQGAAPAPSVAPQAVASRPPTAQRIDPIIAPVKRAAPAKTQIDPALAASIKTKGAQLATAVKAVPKKDAVTAAKAALASAKVAMAKALASQKAGPQKATAKAKPAVAPPAKTAVKAQAVTNKPAAATKPL
jgi:hypothetical protein